jgi:NitT/TauT family transport system ATP-binding protein
MERHASESAKPIIKVDNLTKSFRQKDGSKQTVLSNLNLTINKGELFCLLGRSGCGKTTLLNIIAGFDKPSIGKVIINEVRVSAPSPNVMMIFQGSGLLPWRTVLGNVELGLEGGKLNRNDRREICMDYLKLVGMDSFSNHHPNELSGGMKQRVALARSLAVEPEIILLDEPFSALDTFTRYNMQEELYRIWEEKKMTVVFVTHDIDEATYLFDKIAIMHRGDEGFRIIKNKLPRPRNRTAADFYHLRGEIFREFHLVAQVSDDYSI